MKRLIISSLLTAGALYCQNLDLSSLDKLAAKAKSVARVSLNRDQLQAALSVLSSTDKDSAKDMQGVKELVQKLTGIEVRNFEFAQKGAYSEADVAPVREQMARMMGTQKGCSKSIDVKEEGEHTEIYLCTENGKTSALGVIAAEAQELSVILLKGSPSLKDLQGLGGVMALPSMGLGPGDRKSARAGAH
jgi:hypothetical protein